jgi:hypothetical protein
VAQAGLPRLEAADRFELGHARVDLGTLELVQAL